MADRPTDCLFCKIRDGQIPAKKVYEDERCFAFRDIQPQAPTHILICPRTHVPTLNDLAAEQEALAGHLLVVGARLAKDEGFADGGWRAVFNVNADAGQLVFHVHLHVLGGRTFDWPPG
jgi:histidine triad (HIT) family protein